ncbi:MAG: dTDP-4-dehydrorhamnose reductase [Candidatus Sumerlaeota bacterium]|nr:dTDP-4-dehydrorhamnose reductase [Candidatus Sumerlaeota bacterium]
MKDVLITGSEGMLGSEVVRHLKRRTDVRVIRGTQASLDITNVAAVKALFEVQRPTHVVHCAAFTQVDTAEKDPLTAYMVNSEGTKNLAFFAREFDSEFLYVSTDYVFDGDKGEPYLETDETNPINVYGDSKLRGEQYVQTLCERHKIVRTSWLNGLAGMTNRNFIETMLRFSETRDQLSVVNDQTGRPTFTFDLAPAIALLLDMKAYGTFHVTGEGSCTWFDLATKVFEIAGKEVTLKPVTSDQFRSLARRPRHSVLLNTRFKALGLPLLPEWEDSLREYFRRRRLAESVRRPESRGPSRDAQYAS